mgnify:CR=1 FL=1
MDKTKIDMIKNVKNINDICKVLKSECNPAKDWRLCLPKNKKEIGSHFNISKSVLKQKSIPDLPGDWKVEFLEYTNG